MTALEAGPAPWAMSPISQLFPQSNERLRIENELTRQLSMSQDRVRQGPVTPTLNINNSRAELADFDPDCPTSIDKVLRWTIDALEQGVVHLNHPRYFGLFNPSPSFPAQCADRIVAAFNPQLATWSTSPLAVEIESKVIQAMGRRAGLAGQVGGHFTTGGSEANYTALLLALIRANPEFAVEGARAFAHRPVFYISRDSHLAWIKIAHQAGIGRAAVRMVNTDGTGRMDTQHLRQLMEQDQRNGCLPVMIVATAGTTNAGAIDPLPDCQAAASAAGAWFHVDAAWGGAVIASKTLSHLLNGIDKADSVTIDAHKWFATTMGCGMFLTRHPAALSSAFQVAAGYMPSSEPSIDPYMSSLQWSRRFLGLRLFLSLAVAGWSGYAQHIERCVGLAAYLAERLQVLGWSVINDPSLAVLCIVPPAGSRDVPGIVHKVLASGNVWTSRAQFEGRDVVRACITSGLTQKEDIHALIAELQQAAAETIPGKVSFYLTGAEYAKRRLCTRDSDQAYHCPR